MLAWSDLEIQADPNNRNRMLAMVDQGKVDAAPRYEARRDRRSGGEPEHRPAAV